MGPGPDGHKDPGESEKEIRIMPGDNGEANRLAVPLREIFEGNNK
jgi:hypothetical protein